MLKVYDRNAHRGNGKFSEFCIDEKQCRESSPRRFHVKMNTTFYLAIFDRLCIESFGISSQNWTARERI